MALPWHTCNAYCRDGRHAQVVWGPPAFDRDATRRELAIVLRIYGAAVLDVAPAPEARVDERRLYHEVARLPLPGLYLGAAARRPDPTYVPWLVTYEDAQREEG